MGTLRATASIVIVLTALPAAAQPQRPNEWVASCQIDGASGRSLCDVSMILESPTNARGGPLVIRHNPGAGTVTVAGPALTGVVRLRVDSNAPVVSQECTEGKCVVPRSEAATLLKQMHQGRRIFVDHQTGSGGAVAPAHGPLSGFTPQSQRPLF